MSTSEEKAVDLAVDASPDAGEAATEQTPAALASVPESPVSEETKQADCEPPTAASEAAPTSVFDLLISKSAGSEPPSYMEPVLEDESSTSPKPVAEYQSDSDGSPPPRMGHVPCFEDIPADLTWSVESMTMQELVAAMLEKIKWWNSLATNQSAAAALSGEQLHNAKCELFAILQRLHELEKLVQVFDSVECDGSQEVADGHIRAAMDESLKAMRFGGVMQNVGLLLLKCTGFAYAMEHFGLPLLNKVKKCVYKVMKETIEKKARRRVLMFEATKNRFAIKLPCYDRHEFGFFLR